MPKQGKILVVVSGLKGLMLSSFALVKRLQKKGHTVLWASITDNEGWAKANEIEEIQLPDFISKKEVNSSPISKATRFLKRYTQSKSGLQNQIEQLKIEELSTIFNAQKFDLIISDIELHEVILAAHKVNKKTILLSPWFSLHQSDFVPPISSSTPFDGNTIRKEEWERMREKNQKQEKQFDLKHASISRKNALKKVADEIDFKENNWIEHEWPQPFHYKNILTISTTIKGLDYPGQTSGNQLPVGAFIDLNRTSPNRVDFDFSPILKAKEDGKKVILFTLSSFNTEDEKSFELLFELANKRDDLFWIIAPTDKSNSSKNIFCSQWVPQLELLKHVDLSINHGGINTINECINHQVPMIIYSGDKHDQNGCMTRCVYHGIAKTGPSLEQLEQKVDETLSDESIKEKLKLFLVEQNKLVDEEVFEKIVQKQLDA